MSGPKTATLSSARRRARERLAPLRQRVEVLAVAAARDAAHCARLCQDLDAAQRKLRAELAAHVADFETRAGQWKGVRELESTLVQLLGALNGMPSADQCQRALDEMTNAMASGRGVDAVEGTARLLLGNAVGVDSAMAAAEALLRSSPETALGSGAQESESHERVMSAIRMEIAREEAAAGALGGDAAMFQTLDEGAHAEQIARARQHLDSGEGEKGAAALKQAQIGREAAVLEASRIRQQVKERDAIAAALVSGLSQVNYDAGHVYLQGSTEDERAPLVVYAANPAGSAHLRAVIHLDGRMDIDIEGVPEGEEQMCIDLLAVIDASMRDIDESFTVEDLGRAKQLSDALQERTRVRERARGEGD